MDRRYWLAATDAEASVLFTTKVTSARNPFDGSFLELTMVESIDEPALRARPHDLALALSPYQVAIALACDEPTTGALLTSPEEGDDYSRIAFRLPPDRLAAIVETDEMALARAWSERLHGVKLADGQVAAMKALARAAVARAGTVWCFELFG